MMKQLYTYILCVLLVGVACQPINNPQHNTHTTYDSVFTSADIQWHKQYYPTLNQQVFSIDLLSSGLSFDSAYHISGTGTNLFLSDIFLPISDSTLQEGTYRIDTTAASYTLLPYTNFEGQFTGCYMLYIQNDALTKYIGFTAGEMQVAYQDPDVQINFTLYTADSTCYHATYIGPYLQR